MLSKQRKSIIFKHFWKNANMNKIKMGNLIDLDLEKSESDESDSNSNIETESNYECDE